MLLTVTPAKAGAHRRSCCCHSREVPLHYQRPQQTKEPGLPAVLAHAATSNLRQRKARRNRLYFFATWLEAARMIQQALVTSVCPGCVKSARIL